MVNLAELEVGQVVAQRSFELDRAALVRYAGASGDFNPIHYNDVFAESVGLPGVIAHGMLTLGMAATVIEDWVGPGRVQDFQARFIRPIPVPNPGVAEISVTVKVNAVEAAAGTLTVEAIVEFNGQKVLGKAIAEISLG